MRSINKVQRTCQFCGKSFETWPSRPGIYCSKQCTTTVAARAKKPNKERPENFRWLTCEVCQEKYRIHKCYTESRKSRFCSNKCRYAAKKKQMTGSENPNYRHGNGGKRTSRRGNWRKVRKEIMERDGYKCRICHSTGPRLCVHHIIPYMDFDDDWKLANQPENLILLCPSCHRKVEYGNLCCPKP